MIKRLIISGLLLLGISTGKAQQVSLTPGEIKNLVNEIKHNDAATYLYGEVYYKAQQSSSEQPNPIQKIRSQGLLQGNPLKIATLKALEDAKKVYAMALVYRITGQRTFLEKSTDFLMSWASVNKPTGDPIDETKLEDMILGYDLIRPALGVYQRYAIDSWLDEIAKAEMNSESAAAGKTTAKNNWNSQRIKTIALAANTIHTDKYDSYIIDQLEKQLAANLNPDGSTFDYYQRDALHYHIYSLEPLLKTIIVLYRKTGKNYFDFKSPAGSSIKKSVDFLVPYVTGEKKHPEFVNSKVDFDKARSNNNEKDFKTGADFEPAKGIVVLALASYFDKRYLEPIYKASAKGESYYDWQLLLNHVRKPFENKAAGR